MRMPMNPMSHNPPHKDAYGATVKSASRVLDILELLAIERQGLSLTDMSQRLSIPMSSLHGLLRTLHDREYLVRDHKGGTYRLGPRLLLLSQTHMDGVEVIDYANAIMERVHLLTGESVSLAVREGTDVIFVSKRTSPKFVRVVNPVGTRLPLHLTALGKSILALMSHEDLEELYPDESLPLLTPNGASTTSELMQCLVAVREEGVAFDREESAVGVWAVAAAIRDQLGKAVAALSVAVPSPYVTAELEERLAKLVATGAALASRELGYVSDGLPKAGALDALDETWLEG